jgi:hypothetical protein
MSAPRLTRSGATIERALPLLVVPLVALLVLTGDRSLIFNHPGYLDPWIYHALYTNLAAIKELFPWAYYPTRLSLILPGYLAYQLFPTLTANYVLHLLVWLAAVTGLYIVVNHVAGRRSALVAATVFGFFPYVWRAVGWDYPDGIGNAYYLLTTACLTLAGATRTTSWRYLFLAGIASAAAFYCNLTWAFMLPSFGPYWFFVRKARDFPLALGRTLLFAAAGFLFLSLVLALWSYQVSGVFLFYLPSITYAISGVQEPSTYAAPDNRWILTSPWLYLPMAAAAASVIILVRLGWRQGDFRTRMAVALTVNFLFCLGVLIAWELAGQPLLQISYYASYLLASMFLFLGVTVLQVPDTGSTKTFYRLLAAVVAIGAWFWWDPRGTTWLWMVRWSWTPLVATGIAAVIIGALLAGRVSATIITAVGVSLLSLTARLPTTGFWFADYSAAQTEDAFLRIAEGIAIARDAARPARMLRFWYDSADRSAPEFNSINSGYLWGPTKIGTDYPKPPELPAEGLTAILSSLPEPERASAFTTARESLQRIGFTPRVVANHVINRGGVRYRMTIVHLELDMAAIRAYGYVRNGDFESGSTQWTAGSASVSVVDGGQSGKALALAPKEGTGQYAMQWNFARLEQGRKYRLVVWTKSGSGGDEPFVVGIWDNTANRYVASRHGMSSPDWEQQEVEFVNDSANPLSIELMKNSSSKNPILFDSVTFAEVQ